MAAIQVTQAVCCGIDVHKRELEVCLIWREADGNRQSEVRTYGSASRHLLALRDWLEEHGCQAVAMESTGVYWKPIFNVLEGALEVLLVNPTHLKNVPGRNTDVKDCEWLAELLEHGLLKGSFIPPVEIRDLTRYRRKLVQAKTDEVNRLQKILEDANIKLASVATDVMGVSGREMIPALIAGGRDPERLAELARGRLRNKTDELKLALEGLFRPHHAGLLGMILSHIQYLVEPIGFARNIAELETKIDLLCEAYAKERELLDTAPGVNKRSAQDLIAEIGVDMSHFPSHKHLCSWAGISPGNNESGGKRKSGKTTSNPVGSQGNKWLKAILVECGHSAGRTKDTYLGSKFGRLCGRTGKKRAAVAVGHDILAGAFFIIRDKVPWQELGPDYLDAVKKKQPIRHHLRRLEDLGVKVDVQE